MVIDVLLGASSSKYEASAPKWRCQVSFIRTQIIMKDVCALTSMSSYHLQWSKSIPCRENVSVSVGSVSDALNALVIVRAVLILQFSSKLVTV